MSPNPNPPSRTNTGFGGNKAATGNAPTRNDPASKPPGTIAPETKTPATHNPGSQTQLTRGQTKTQSGDKAKPESSAAVNELKLEADAKTGKHFIQLDSESTCEVQLPENVTPALLTAFKPFWPWVKGMQQSLALQKVEGHRYNKKQYKLRSVAVLGAKLFGPKKIGFSLTDANITTEDPADPPLNATAFLRGPSVAILLIVGPKGVKDDERYVVLTVQPRQPGGTLASVEVPAGMLENGDFAGTAAKEVEEETGIKINKKELTNMSEFFQPRHYRSQDYMHHRAAEAEDAKNENISRYLREPRPIGTYMSIGGTDEYITMYVCQKEMEQDEISALPGRVMGRNDEGELITVKLIKLKHALFELAADGKSWIALTMYREMKARMAV